MNLIKPFDPWNSKLCTCPKKFSLSPYTGCSHLCLYCYASSYIKNFFLPREKKNFLERLKKEIRKLPKGSYISMANSSDPYLALEKKLKLTQKTLEILKEFDLKIMIVTKSSLILRDINLLKEFKNIVIAISITTLKDSLAKRLEKLAPLPKERLNAIEKLAKHFKVVCRLDPLIYPLNTHHIKEIIKELKNRGTSQIITSTYKAKPDNFKRMLSEFPEYKDLWIKLYMKEGEKICGYRYLPQSLRRKIIQEVREIVLREKLEFSSCREGFSDLNTEICDGSGFFKD